MAGDSNAASASSVSVGKTREGADAVWHLVRLDDVSHDGCPYVEQSDGYVTVTRQRWSEVRRADRCNGCNYRYNRLSEDERKRL